jgi:hypothetical protein
VNAAQTSWKAGLNQYFNTHTYTELRRIMGVKFNESLQLDEAPAFTEEQIRNTPASLDLRTRTVGNTSCIGPVLDQV